MVDAMDAEGEWCNRGMDGGEGEEEGEEECTRNQEACARVCVCSAVEAVALSADLDL